MSNPKSDSVTGNIDLTGMLDINNPAPIKVNLRPSNSSQPITPSSTPLNEQELMAGTPEASWGILDHSDLLGESH